MRYHGPGSLCRVRQRTLTFALTLMNDPWAAAQGWRAGPPRAVSPTPCKRPHLILGIKVVSYASPRWSLPSFSLIPRR